MTVNWRNAMSTDSQRQKQHYEAIHAEYEDHYYDPQSMLYRERFFFAPLFDGLDLNGKHVLDLASGSGHNSLALLRRFPTATVTGFDISASACQDYRRNVGRPCIEGDLTASLSASETFDAAMILGGLHHCVMDLNQALENVGRLVRPGGVFLMLEPNREFMLEGARRLWYRMDRYFDAPTEAALAHDEVLKRASPLFSLRGVRYMGGPGYFLISQSLLFRVPKSVKRALTPPLMCADGIYNRLKGRWLYPYFVAQWYRNEM
jgi:SAM-dependent methyltransferase